MITVCKANGVFILLVVLLACSCQHTSDTVNTGISDSARAKHGNWTTPAYKTVKAYILSNNLAYSYHGTINKDNGKEYFLERVKTEKNVVLSEAQITRIESFFSAEPDSFGIADCFNPRHTVVYYDRKNKPIGAVLICFECGRTETFPATKEGLNGYTDHFRSLFAELGLPVFNDPNQHQAYIDSLKMFRSLKK